MCKVVGREGTASLVVIPALVEKISQENERGGLEIAPPPVGRGLRTVLFNVILQKFADRYRPIPIVRKIG